MKRKIRAYWLSSAGTSWLVIACFVFGGLFGCLLCALSSPQSTRELSVYLEEYVAFTKQNSLIRSIPTVFWSYFQWIVVCLLFSMTGFGLIALPLMIGLRGFLIVFGISCFVRCYGSSGFLPASLLFGVPALLWVPALFLVCGSCFQSSFRLFQGRNGDALLPRPGRDVLRAGVMAALFFLALCVLYECFLLPSLLPSAVMILK